MDKRKGRFEGKLDFISNLPLQECISRLEYLNSDELIIHFHRNSSDSIEFEAYLSERGVIRAEANGMLRRWEGTLTRVDCNVKVREGVLRWLVLLSLSFFVLSIGVPMIFMLGAAVNMLMWLGISSVFVVAFVGMLWLTMYFAPLDDTPKNLMQMILSALDD